MQWQITLLKVMNSCQATVFFATLTLVIYITFRTLIPLREKRPYVICFYILAALQALC